MKKSNNTYTETISKEMIELIELARKYSISQFVSIVTAVDLDKLQLDMEANGATKEELRASSECYHDIWEAMYTWCYSK